MDYIKDLVPELRARLPELELQLSYLHSSVLKRHLPPGIFSTKNELSAVAYVHEIKNDLSLLAKQEKMLASTYLAEQINRKINVLVGICQLAKKAPGLEGHKAGISIKKLSNRQQWLHEIENEIQVISVRKKALEQTLTHMKANTDPSLLLKIKAELGQVEHQLTLANELLNKNTG
jgi:hypothetical protein